MTFAEEGLIVKQRVTWNAHAAAELLQDRDASRGIEIAVAMADEKLEIDALDAVRSKKAVKTHLLEAIAEPAVVVIPYSIERG